MMASIGSTTKTRVIVLSDTHNAARNHLAKHAFRDPLPKADVLIHCGDLTMKGRIPEYETTNELINSFDAELKLVIAGNHDLSLDRAYRDYGRSAAEEKAEKDEAERVWKYPPAKGSPIRYLEEGLHSFTLRSGAKFTVYASPYTPEFCDWGFPYERNEDRWNPPHQVPKEAVCITENPIPDFPRVDILVTHGPPQHHLGTTSRDDDAGCPHLFRALQRAKPRLHCFGHIHEGWGAELIDWTKGGPSNEHATWLDVDLKQAVKDKAVYLDLTSEATMPVVHGQSSMFINAAIMDHHYRPTHPPWLIDIDLPCSG